MKDAGCNSRSTLIANVLAELAVVCLHQEIDTYPKPGLVSHVDNGAHKDMDAPLFHRSADSLKPYYFELARAGAEGAQMDTLRKIGTSAEQAMLAVTGGINTHRGAIFGLGMLVAAAGLRAIRNTASPLGDIVKTHWGEAILIGPILTQSHGARAMRRYAVGGARMQAAQGFPALYKTGLPALHSGRQMRQGNEHAARVQACFALIAVLDDTNLLHRGGSAGLLYAQQQAHQFLKTGGVGAADWERRAVEIHHQFIGHNLSPGGAADLLAMTLFVDAEHIRHSDRMPSISQPETTTC